MAETPQDGDVSIGGDVPTPAEVKARSHARRRMAQFMGAAVIFLIAVQIVGYFFDGIAGRLDKLTTLYLTTLGILLGWLSHYMHVGSKETSKALDIAATLAQQPRR